MRAYTIRTALAALVGGLLVAGCGGSSGSDDASGIGTVSFAATDAPADNLTEVQVTFDKIELQPQGGQRQTFAIDPPRSIDLLEQTGDDSAPILVDATVPAGEYTSLRLFVVGGENPPGGGEGSFVQEDGGGVFDLFIPGQQNAPPQSQGQRRFLQLSSPFTVPAGGDADFTIDFELNKALTKIDNAQGIYYLLRPSLRLVNNVEAGSITGEVDLALSTQSSCGDGSGESVSEGNAVYLYEGLGAIAGDVNLTAAQDSQDDNPQPDHDSDDTDGEPDEVNPVAVATAENRDEDTQLEYTIGFVAEGNYTVVFTCEAERDSSPADEDITFQQPQNVTVDADNDPEIVNFTPCFEPGCSGDDPLPVALDQEFQLGLSQQATIEEEALTLSFSSVDGDSRCPTGVECVRAGDATIGVVISKAEIPAQELTLSVPAPNTAIYLDYSVTLVALDPYPVHGQPTTQPEEYVATLIVTKP